MRLLSLIAIAVLSAAPSACADNGNGEDVNNSVESVSSEISASFDERLKAFIEVIDGGEMSRSTDFMPPMLLKEVLNQNNVTRVQMEKQLDAVWVQTLASVEINNYSMDGASKPIMTSSSGRHYRVIPTNMNMTLKANNSKVIASSESLGLFENDDWYFVRLDDANMTKAFYKLYPELKAVEIMTPTMTINGEKVKP